MPIRARTRHLRTGSGFREESPEEKERKKGYFVGEKDSESYGITSNYD
jgi:hypothetical protein